jgi:2-amino-4-hydroxy-6-hydroxymethyldihydropteridine diphosphokinase
LGLGSNVGNKRSHLRQALGLLESECRVEATSTFYSTEPVGYREQNWFLNCAARVETELGPQELLEIIGGIEAQLGRERTIPNGPRTIDIDILLFDSLVIDSGGLTIPHPRMHERLFVLEPLAEIAAEVVHPVLGLAIGELLGRLPATHRVELAPDGD